VHRHARARQRLGLPVQRHAVHALGHHHVRHEAGAVLPALHRLRRGGRQHALAAPAGECLLHVHLLLQVRRHVLVHHRPLALAQRAEVRPAALRAHLVLRGHRVVHLPLGHGGARGLVGAALLQRLFRGRRLVPAQLLADGRHLLASLSEDGAGERLQLAVEAVEPFLEDGVLPAEAFRLVAPLARVSLGDVHRAGEIKSGSICKFPRASFGGVHRAGRRTRATSMPSSSIASWVASSCAPSASFGTGGRRKRPDSSRL